MTSGLRVLITRPAAQSAGIEALLRQRGAEPLSLPLFEIQPVQDDDAHRHTIESARRWNGWLFTSVNAAREAARLDTGDWPTLYAIGQATANALAALGHPGAHHAPTGSSSEDLLAHPALQQVQGQRFLICTGEGGRDTLATGLRARGADTHRLELYRRVPVDHPAAAVRTAVESCDAIICTSGEGLGRLRALLPDELLAHAQSRLLVVPSPRVLELARRLGFAEVRAPQRTSDEALVDCLFPPARTQVEDSASASAPTMNSSQQVEPSLEAGDTGASSAPSTPAFASPASPRPEASRKRGGLLGFVIVLLLALGAAGAFGWLWWEQREQQEREATLHETLLQKLDSRIAALETVGGEQATRLADQSRLVDRNGTDIAALQSRIEDTLALMSRISEDLSGGRTRFQLASVEHLLVLANDRLQLERDVKSALIALDGADASLARLSDPQLFPVREALAQERAALRAVPVPDLASTALTLSSLVERVPSLPLVSHAPSQFESSDARESGAPDSAASGWRRLVQAVQTAARSLFTIRREDNAKAMRLLPPEAEAVIYHVLTLKLEAARVALLTGNTVALREEARSASEWLDAQFKADDPGALAMKGELERLQSVELQPPLPDISRSLTALRARLDATR